MDCTRMGIELQAYRASIGVFMGRVRDKRMHFPSNLFKGKHNFSYGRGEWSNFLVNENIFARRAGGLIKSIIA